jgi:hypothetical protein
MRIGDFRLAIKDSSGQVHEGDENGYVVLRHGEHYTIVLGNDSAGKAVVYGKIDEVDWSGGDAGDKFQLRPYGTFNIEHPACDNGRFTFYATGSDEAAAAGEAAVAKEDKGIVQVTFVPERRQIQPTHDDFGYGGAYRGGPVMRGGGATRGGEMFGGPESFGSTRGGGTKGLGSGISGLAGHSDQQFQQVSGIDEDRDREVTITLRLVHDKSVTYGARPLPGRRTANPVPPSVD